MIKRVKWNVLYDDDRHAEDSDANDHKSSSEADSSSSSTLSSSSSARHQLDSSDDASASSPESFLLDISKSKKSKSKGKSKSEFEILRILAENDPTFSAAYNRTLSQITDSRTEVVKNSIFYHSQDNISLDKEGEKKRKEKKGGKDDKDGRKASEKRAVETDPEVACTKHEFKRGKHDLDCNKDPKSDLEEKETKAKAKSKTLIDEEAEMLALLGSTFGPDKGARTCGICPFKTFLNKDDALNHLRSKLHLRRVKQAARKNLTVRQIQKRIDKNTRNREKRKEAKMVKQAAKQAARQAARQAAKQA